MSDAKHSNLTLPVITDVIPSETHEVPTSEIELGLLQMQILWLLSRKSTHGYDLMKTLTVLRGARMTQGTLYPTMQRLEELGLAQRESVQDRKIVYHITEKGKHIMNETCLAFVKTFYGIFHDYACERCDHYLHSKKEK